MEEISTFKNVGGLDVNAQPKIVFYNFQSKNHYRYTTLRTKFIEFANDVGLPYLNGFHCLRHTHATMCVNAGMDYKILQERLGHEDISMTMNIYAHTLNENKRTALDNVITFMKEA